MPFILDSTREALARLAMQHAGAIGFNPTGIAGFNVVKRIERGEKRSFQKPYAALIFQGRKRTRVGDIEHVYGPGDVVVTCIDFPSFTTIEEASIEKPFLSCVLELNRDLMAELSLMLGHAQAPDDPAGQPFFVTRCEEDIAQNFRRLLELSDAPENISLLAPILIRELHARFLLGPQGAWIRSVCSYGTHSHQIAAAVSMIKEKFREPISVADIAGNIGLSEPSLHRHFKNMTGFSPIKYQKILRLYEGRNILRSGRKTVSGAAFEVGYASSSHFTNDYRKFFGLSPRDDARAGFAA